MKLPDSGSFIETLFDSHVGIADNGGGVVRAVTEPQLAAAIEAMARGDLEFVILEDGDAFIQAAGQDEGPYELNYKPAHEATLYVVSGGVDADAVRAALLSYRRGDGRWRGTHRWSPLSI